MAGNSASKFVSKIFTILVEKGFWWRWFFSRWYQPICAKIKHLELKIFQLWTI